MDIEMNVVIAIEDTRQLLAGGIIAHALCGVAFENTTFQFLKNHQELKHIADHCGLNRFLQIEIKSEADLLFAFSDSEYASPTIIAKRKAIYFDKAAGFEVAMNQDDICFVADHDSASDLKRGKRNHIHLTGAIEIEIPTFYSGKAQIEEYLKGIHQNDYRGDGLASVRIAEILKHTLSPEPGT
jgi:hypothetical protein